jgi:hypothetical protein
MVPRPGDVLVSKPTATLEHDISIVPNPPHLSFATHDAAIQKARELAEDLRVDLWLSEDHIHFLRLASYGDSR